MRREQNKKKKHREKRKTYRLIPGTIGIKRKMRHPRLLNVVRRHVVDPSAMG
jgi:hypothetical protein